jgi:hypothetical protein
VPAGQGGRCLILVTICRFYIIMVSPTDKKCTLQ